MDTNKNDMKKPPETILSPIMIKCQDCGEEFLFSPAEQKFYMAKGYHYPKRCQSCRTKKKNDIVDIVCIDCGTTFHLDGYEQEYFKNKNQPLPKRCRSCRDIKRKRNEELNGTSEEPML